ncbi:hypothetical protein COCMIDRAFT_101819 [Bipolaris oryzae ATCC 44560]|uniref:Uncharacterized protein n=1 Tax=Bipolaris oryzae ATCC 44560 TaxID=930090 RepID=W6YUE1_COCMI|nr:uncharacterized protein COCMIDRAFT_101819 [Bipolaris oryzae ATCC 44560]EUC43077.1 hypothetical protein COCMIDRAFT_101819 [Bipolaris oryzae ATCC 44560]
MCCRWHCTVWMQARDVLVRACISGQKSSGMILGRRLSTQLWARAVSVLACGVTCRDTGSVQR